jgi:chlorobactene glucosyltransferase
MTTLALAASAVLLPMLAVALWNLAAAPRLHQHAAATGGWSVSVLVPARDEAANLRVLIPALLASRYRPFEVVILDDDSADDTLAVARGFARQDERVSVVGGLDLPDGWTGKNWACHQLSRIARGDVLLFCDADVRPGPEAIGRSISALRDTGAGALTAFPRHERGGWAEEAVVPIVAKLPIAALLPLPLVPGTRSPALAVGNGQWFAWRRSAYDAAGGHGSVRGAVLEDVELARRAKRAGAGLLAAIGTRDLTVRMYLSPGAVRDGFVKNLYPLLGGRVWALALSLGVFLLAMVMPLVTVVAGSAAPATLVPLGLLIAVRSVSAALFGERPTTLLLHPVGAALVPLLAVESWWRHASARVAWKGRVVAAPEAP